MREITENNKLIAEFMGWKYFPKDSINGHCGVLKKIGKGDLLLDHTIAGQGSWAPKYHSSWNWLMPVVEKIENTGYISTIEKMNLNYTHRVWFNDAKTYQEVAHGARDETKLIAVYEAVIDFIKWHNSNLI